MNKLIIITTLVIISLINNSYAYTFGILSHDDTIKSIQNIEENYKLTLPMISFIRDNYGEQEQHTLNTLPQTLGTWKIYHITVSPLNYTSKQVYQWYYDWEYSLFFKHVKKTNIKVIFRTMHEMNGGRYPWSGNPTSFKQAWRHIYQLSREAGLDQSQILFDFSTNGWDMPVSGWWVANQSSQLIKCSIQTHQQTQCLRWEDYYPWDDVVNMVGVSFYNRGKATSNRKRYTPTQIMDEPDFMIWERLKSKNKPIIVDEVGTTSVRYTGSYNRDISLKYYTSDSGAVMKNIWLGQLATRAKDKKELAALNYFNVDRTMWLAWENPWEADWSAIDLDYNRYYSSIMKLYQWWDQNLIKLFITPEQKKKEHIGIWSTKKTKKIKPNNTWSIISSKFNPQ